MIPTFIVGSLVSIIFAGMVLFGLILEIKDADNYWKSMGFGDWFRMPLEYPYELVTTSLDSDAEIRVWEKDSTILNEVTKYYKDGYFITGEIVPHISKRRYVKLEYEDVSTNETREEFYAGQKATKEFLAKYPEKKWFIFNCSTGIIKEFESHENYLDTLKSMGFEKEPELLSIWENWKLFWNNPKKPTIDEQNK